YAGKSNYRFVVILGEEELGRGQAGVKDMASGEQQNVALGEIAAYLTSRLSRS
ncbi:MAG: histidine--tRNA ligase, partial [Clostridia bacterium]|nr:histidine--tRNA ligase [Clostridia bacterium]